MASNFESFRLLTVRRATTHGKPSTTLNDSHAYKKSSPHAILNRFADDLALLPLQPRSQKSYWACVRQLAEHFDRSPDLVSAEELRQYFIHLKNERRFARQSSTQALCSIKLFWEKTLQRRWPAELELARATPQFKLPVVLSAAEVRSILAKVEALDHRVALSTIYACGLRLGEGLRLEVRDIDSHLRRRAVRLATSGPRRHNRSPFAPCAVNSAAYRAALSALRPHAGSAGRLAPRPGLVTESFSFAQTALTCSGCPHAKLSLRFTLHALLLSPGPLLLHLHCLRAVPEHPLVRFEPVGNTVANLKPASPATSRR